MISTRTELAIAGAVLAAGLGGWAVAGLTGADAPPTAERLAAALLCTAADRIHSDAGVHDTVACRRERYHGTVVTFDDNRQRDDWVTRMHRPFVSGSGQLLLSGDRWAVQTDDFTGARHLLLEVKGWWA
ncbi:hypothetical protein ABT369_33315 [Dactylosporangium sp. NPDC000244]|uniref:hypothetical protein n=1 Tax=Dactylosporangium sp. NPDC000244 TaxID=3154365 RepID=UPI00331DF893